MPKERVLITVKTYPTLSSKYSELVCTAGFREDGSWIRIYPSPFRFLDEDQHYKKYQWIELDLEKNPTDPRPESYRPINIDDIKLGKEIGPGGQWEERRKLILGKNLIHTNLNVITEAAKQNLYSLVIFKPTKITDFKTEQTDREWEITKKQAAEASLKQGSLFEENLVKNPRLMPKLPYVFSYTFEDDVGKESTLMIEDWEIGQLYWSCFKKYNCEETAVQKVREKYLDDFAHTKDLYLFLGTTRRWHGVSPNPYVIIGTFHPAPITQGVLL